MKFYHRYEPLLELNKSKYSVIVLTGGRGSQKTGHALRGILFNSMLEKKKTCFFRETKETLNESLKAELDGIIDTEFKGCGFSSTQTKITHTNGSQMFFKGLKEVNTAAIENLKGIATTTDFFVVDEAQAVSMPVWDVLIPTLRKEGCVLIAIYNRIDNKLPVEEALMLNHKKMSAPDNTYFIEVNFDEILASEEMSDTLSKEFLYRAFLLKENKPDKYDQLYLNKANAQHKMNVVKYFTEDNVREAIPYCEDLPLYLTCDFNVDPMCWGVAHIDFDDELNPTYFFIDEICVENTTTKECALEFIRRYPEHKSRIYIHGDASGRNRSTQSEKHNYSIIKNVLVNDGKYNVDDIELKLRRKNPNILHRISAWNNKVKDIHGNVGIYFSKKCKWCIFNCEELEFKQGTSIVKVPTSNEIEREPEKKFLEHPFDAISYLVEYYSPIRNEAE